MFESVISANFDAVALLRYGLFDESATHLRSALMTIQRTRHMSPSCQDERSISCPSVSSVLVADKDNNKEQAKRSPNTNNDTKKTPIFANQTSCFDIFNRGFLLEDAVNELPYTEETSAVCASVCLYNMALALHLKGLSKGSAASLRRASGLYEKVYTILCSLAPSPADSLSCMILAAVLNIIACESELRGHAAVEEWKNTYSNLYTWATQGSSCPAVFGHPQDLSFFTTSAVLFQNQEFAAAPAA